MDEELTAQDAADATHEMIMKVIRRKRAEHYQHAVDRGIITSEQRIGLLELMEEELAEMEAQAEEEPH